MHEDTPENYQQFQPGLTASYLKLASAIVVGAALALGIYFFVLENNTQGQAGQTPHSNALCVCPNCGLTVHKPNNVDCEEINCPNCGHSMNPAATLAAGAVGPAAGAGNQTFTQNQRETLAEQGIATPGPMTQNQRETLAQQGVHTGRAPAGAGNNAAGQPSPRLAALNPVNPSPAPGTATCICPGCGQMINTNAGVSCPQVSCPNCRAPMTNAVMVGRGQVSKNQNQAQLAAAQMPAAGAGCPLHGNAANLGTTVQQIGLNQGTGVHQGTAMQGMHRGTAMQGMHQGMGGGMGGGMHQGMMHHPNLHHPNLGTLPANTAVPAANSAANQITYSNTVHGIVSRNCYRCHSGPMRNLTTYNRVKGYVDNGLLMMMVQPGGPMSRFLSADEAQQVISWIKAGAPP